jgi:serine/threonine-protein kinase RsbW
VVGRRRHPEKGWEAVIEHDHTLDLTAGATPGTARAWRRQFEEWLRAEGVAVTTAEDLGHAVYEALANAVEHAYPPEHPDPVVRLRAQFDGVRVQVTVYDYGTWSPPGDPGYRGHGFTMMRKLTDEVHVDATRDGTAVRLCATLDPGR